MNKKMQKSSDFVVCLVLQFLYFKKEKIFKEWDFFTVQVICPHVLGKIGLHMEAGSFMCIVEKNSAFCV